MIVANHRTYAKFDFRTMKKKTNTLELYSFVLYIETPPRRFVFSWPFRAVKDLEFIGCSVISHKNLIGTGTYRAPYTDQFWPPIQE